MCTVFECLGSWNKPQFSFGVVADVQYADIDDVEKRTKDGLRYFRGSLSALRQAVSFWQHESPHPVSLILQLGDLIDGRNKKLGQSDIALREALAEFDGFPGSIHHTWGNHELYNFKRVDLLQSKLNSAPAEGPTGTPHSRCYYAFYPHPKFCFIMLDTYEKTLLGLDESDPAYLEAEAYVRQHNTNTDLNQFENLAPDDLHFAAFNGGVGVEQLRWLDQTLQDAQDAGSHVVIAGHLPICPGSCVPPGLSWNYADILAVLHKYKCVVAYFAGHDHDGGHRQDEHGIHHITFHGLIEALPGSPDYGTVHVYADKMKLVGHGRIPSITMNISPL